VYHKIRFGTPNVPLFFFFLAIKIGHFRQCVSRIWLSCGVRTHLKEHNNHHSATNRKWEVKMCKLVSIQLGLRLGRMGNG
jgi:hypothetical protein